ncbi:MAG: thiamine pyrophosphate-dependent enzyme, partial [Rhodothermales bacterium]|nr:thiamine pyrophosphate-dependent enzyme [Rhodothermales bacterium]
GQEAVSTGTVHAHQPDDPIITAYRDHGLGLARGMTANESMAELFGKIDGCSRGKGGSMHFFSAEKRLFGGHGIVGGHIPVGVGLAFAHKYKEDSGVCLCFFGDGAINQGSFHEAANLAALYKLPVVLVVENNQYAMGTAVHRASAEPDLYKQAVGYDMPGAIADGMDVFDCYRAFSEHIAMARDNQPSLLEVRTYRYRGHSMSDPGKYRTKEELEERKNADPIIRLKAYLLERKLTANDALDKIDDEVKQEVLESVEFAEKSDFPPLETIYQDVYVQDDYPFLS